MAEEIKIIATLEDKNLTTGLNKVQTELAQTAVAANKMDSSLQKSAGKFSTLKEEAKNTAGALTGLGGSLPSIALAGLTLLLIEGGKALFEYANKISVAAQANKDLNDSLTKSGASVAGAVTKLQALVAIARDVSQSDATRSEALGKLNKDYDVFNGKLTLSNINTAEATKLIDAQTAAIVRNAQIKGLENLITKESEKRAEILTQSLEKNLSTFQKIKAAGVGLFTIGGISAGIGQGINDALDSRTEAIKESIERENIFTKALKETLLVSAQAGDLFKEPIEKAAKAAKKLKEEINSIPKIKFFKEDLIKSLPQGELPPITIPVIPVLKPLGKIKWLGDITKEMNEAMQKLSLDLAFTFGDTLGKALAGQASIGDLFKGLFSVLGDALQNIGKIFLETAVAVSAFKKFILSNPTVAIAAGIGLIALGALIKAKTTKTPAFATGGVTEGGQVLLGERGPELVTLPKGSKITPNAQTNSLLGGQMVYIPELTIRGQDMIVVFNRASQANRRNGQ